MEYVTEWPPKEEEDGALKGDGDLDPPPAKRGRHGLESGGEELDLAHADPSILAELLLARWWKLKLRDPATRHWKDLVPVSSNPHTLLYHVARLTTAAVSSNTTCRCMCISCVATACCAYVT